MADQFIVSFHRIPVAAC